MKNSGSRFSVLEVALLYLIIGLIWILLNDYLTHTYGESAHIISKVSAICFVLFSSFLFYTFFEKFLRLNNDLKSVSANIDAIFDTTNELVVFVDQHLKIIKFNKLFENYVLAHLNKFPKAGEDYSTYILPEYKELFYVHFRKVMEGETLVTEQKIEIPKMPTIWFHIHYKPIKNETGQVNHFIITLTDISTTKNAEIDLQNSKIKFETIFQECDEGIIILHLPTLEIFDYNKNAVSYFSIKTTQFPESFYLKKTLENTPLFSKIVSASLHHPSDTFEYTEDLPIKLYSGHTEWFSFHAKKISFSGADYCIVWVRIITELKNHQLKLIESEEKFKNLVNSTPVFLWTSNEQGRITFCNQAWLDFTGWNTSQLTGEGWNQSIHPDDQYPFEQLIYYPSIQQRKPYEAEYRLRRYDGEWRWLHEKGVPRFDSNGNFEGFYGSAIDITEQKNMMLRLEENEQKFKELANSSPVMSWTADTEGLLTFFNTAWLEFTGEKFENQIGEGWIQSVHPDDVERFVHGLYYPSVLRRSEYLAEYRLRRHDGVYCWVMERGVPKFDTQQKFKGFFGSTIDITDRKLAELELKNHQEFVTKITELAPDFIYLHDLVLKKNIFTNRNMASMLGYPADLYPELTEDLFAQWVHPDDKKHVLYSDSLLQRMKTNKYMILRYRLKNSKDQWQWFESFDTVFKTNEHGYPVQILGYTRDVTLSVEAQQKIIESQNFNEAIVQTSPTLIFIFEIRTFRITFANNRFLEISGYHPQEIVSMGTDFPQVVIYPDDRDLLKQEINNAYHENSDSVREFQLRIIHKNGEIRWLLINTKIFKRDENGIPLQNLGTARDISESKKIEEMLRNTNKELQTANEELDSFVYRASHDLRSPLASIIGLINLLHTQNNSSEHNQYLDLMKKSVNKLLEVIEDLINHSKNSRLELQHEKVDLEQLLRELIDGLRYMNQADKIHFMFKSDIHSDFYTDRMRIVLAFNNLISNAIKYHDFSKESPYIAFDIVVNPNHAVIKISDNGTGIEPKHKDKVFDMFYRAHKESNGSGLGLYIVKGIMEKIKGKIAMSSEPGVGTTFELEIPNQITVATVA